MEREKGFEHLDVNLGKVTLGSGDQRVRSSVHASGVQWWGAIIRRA